jgi:predicted transcriptional regulator
MTKLLDRAVEAARGLPPERQDEIARVVLQLAGNEEPAVALTAEERAAITASQAAAARGEFATDDEVRAVWARHNL